MGERCPLCPACASEWVYLAEGGAHVLLRLRGGAGGKGGKVLRISKSTLSEEEWSAWEGHHEALSSCLRLKSKLRTGSAVILHSQCVAALRSSCESERPAFRRAASEANNCENWDCRARILLDLSTFWDPDFGLECLLSNGVGGRQVSDSSGLVFEWKPKGEGGIERSLLAPPGHAELRSSISRGRAVQCFKLEREQTAAARGGGLEPRMKGLSDFESSDFFSFSVPRLTKALEALVRVPHNKLKIFEGGKEVPKLEWDACCYRQLGVSLHQVVDRAAKLLCLDPTVRAISLGHCPLGSIGVEGAALLLERLCHIAGRDEALSLLWERIGSGETAGLQGIRCLKKWEGILHQDGGYRVLSPEERLEAHSKAVSAVSSMGEEDCISLLWCWLSASTLRDCSIMMGLRRRADSHEIPFAYCLDVIDTGPKHPLKIFTAAKREECVWAAAARACHELE